MSRFKSWFAQFNNIKLKLIVLYVSVVLIVMAVGGTFMLWRVRSMELDRAYGRLEAFANQAYIRIVQPNERVHFMDAPAWEMLQSEYNIKVVLLGETGIGIAPRASVGWRINDRAVVSAMNGDVGFSVGSVGMDLNANEVQWISFAVPVEHPDGTIIINARMSTMDMNANLVQLAIILVMTVIIVLVVVIVAWFFLADALTRPIVAMSRHAKAMAAGDLSRKITVHSRDEIGTLAQNFNYMSEEIRNYIDQQIKLDTMRKDFVANVSHELRTPLTSIRTYTETLIDGAIEDPPTAKSFLATIDEEAKRMTTLVTDLLELSRLDSKQAALDMDIVDLLGLLRLTIRQCQVLADQKNQNIQFDSTIDSCFTLANATRIGQVINNILSNAVKYSPEGTTIHVTAEIDDRFYVITIRDEGMGVPPESISRIFERFYRVDKARSRAMGGTGLGLAIAKEIMEEHGGGIRAESKPGEGLTMILFFNREVTA